MVSWISFLICVSSLYTTVFGYRVTLPPVQYPTRTIGSTTVPPPYIPPTLPPVQYQTTTIGSTTVPPPYIIPTPPPVQYQTTTIGSTTVPPPYIPPTLPPPPPSYTVPTLPPTTTAPPPYSIAPTTLAPYISGDATPPTTTEINADQITFIIGVQDLSGGLVDSFTLIAGMRMTLAEILADAWTQLIAHVQCVAVMRLAYGSRVIINMSVTVSEFITAEDAQKGEAELRLIFPSLIKIEQVTDFFVLW